MINETEGWMGYSFHLKRAWFTNLGNNSPVDGSYCPLQWLQRPPALVF
jgi:hypothetical protein